MIFRQLYDPDSSTYSYLLADERTRDAVLIDPVREQLERDVGLARELGVTLRYTLETHVHADHVTAGALLRQRVGSRCVVSARAGVTNADVLVDHGDAVTFGHHALEVRATPGHTSGCVTYVLGDLSRAFTGDALLIRGCGRTDFQQGDARTLYRSVHDQIFSLPDDTLLYPGHDYKGRTVTSVREEKLWNPRLGGGRDEAAFVAIMAGLALAPPKKLDVAVPANLRSGLHDGETCEPARIEDWAPLRRSATGAPQVTPEWVARQTGAVRIIDVRQPDEYTGELGHIDGSELVPLDTLEHEVTAWDRARPIVVVCRSGGRSDRAAQRLETLGFERVASMLGGLVRWRDLGLPVAAADGEQG